ncbi:HAMP domain-containing protein [Micromonospora sp. LH3U1]|uniref:HAMP domain-containing protein n=1 Tax=Micromonospora sp. LH3U1 TaxID=3018339 RepID=UPI0023490FFF|nr:HAMP domain-containing protein [Micromonospora sp. LH3U1]WCN82124.1 HAMP domain-containing protein [Micromonospora sp. LH3U1]
MSGRSAPLALRDFDAGSVEDQRQLVAWRLRALDQQLPAAAFPAGTSAPSLVFLWTTMFVVAVAVLGFALNEQRGVLPAVVDSQRDVVTKLASGLQLDAGRTMAELERLVSARGNATDAELLARVVGDGTGTSGAAVVETTSRQTLAVKGAAPPMDLLPPVLPTDHVFAVTTADGPLLVYPTVLDGTRVVLATRPVTMRNLRLNPDAGHGVHMLTADGRSSLMQGANTVDPTHLPRVFEGLSGADSRQSREIVVKEWADRRLLVSSAPVGNTGLVVVSLLKTEVSEGTSGVGGILLGASLLATSLASFVLMRKSLVRPVRALLSQARADACGAQTPHRAPMRIREAHRIARALALTSGDQFPSANRWRPTVLQGLTVAVVVALLWPAAATTVAFLAAEPTVPLQLVRDEESRAEEASSALGNLLNDGLATATRVSLAVDVRDVAKTRRILDRELGDERRFRALYLVDRDGKLVTGAGREPLRTVEPVPGEVGVHLDDAVDRLPVVYAVNQLDDGHAVIGEFDPDRLLGLVRRVDGRVRVVDAELRTILDSEGFQVFQPLQGDLARDVAVEVLPGTTSGRSTTADGKPALIAGTGLTTPTTVAHLEWAVVVEQDVAALRLPASVERRWTLLLAGAVLGIILLTHVWQLYIFVRPLRRLASFSDRMSEGKLDLPVPPQRHDDIGAIAMCTEICRQVRHTGSVRFGGALRLRGAGTDRTTVLPRVRRTAGAHSRATKG